MPNTNNNQGTSIGSIDMPDNSAITTLTSDPDPFGNDREILPILESQGLYARKNIRRYDKFARIPPIDPYNALTTTKEYIFYTKPDLNIFQNNSAVLNPDLQAVPIFRANNFTTRYRDAMCQLQSSSAGGKDSPFMNLLCNTTTSSLSLPSIDADDIETSRNINGTKLRYRLTSFTSDNDFNFSLEYNDTKYLEVYMLFKLYDEYERLKHQGRVGPKVEYIRNKILHDQIAIYKFIVDADGESLIFWAKYYGCYPKGVPRDSFSELPASGGLSFTVDWACQFVEDMDPLILADFNHLVRPYQNGKSKCPIYNLKKNAPEYRWVSLPYIEDAILPARTSTNKIIRPKLKWYL